MIGIFLMIIEKNFVEVIRKALYSTSQLSSDN